MPISFLRKIKLAVSPKPTSVTSQGVIHKHLKTEHVLGAYVFSCKDLKSNQPLFNDGLPSLIFMPRKSDTVRLTKNGETMKFNAAWVCCGIIKNTYWEVPQDLEYVLVLRFKPSSFYSIFSVDPSQFQSNPICNLEDIIDPDWSQIFNKMYEKESLSQKISFLDNVLSSHHITNEFPHLLNSAISYIEEKKGNTTISDVLQQLGKKVNHKWLHRNFVKHIGISPKKYISLQRFIYTYGQYERNKQENLFDLVLLSGYYDYNHFFKDFKGYIGVAPSQYTWD